MGYHAANTTNNGSASITVSGRRGEAEAVGNLSVALVYLAISYRTEI
jgi:hypothetical protein